mgnify:CR=1 FL=1
MANITIAHHQFAFATWLNWENSEQVVGTNLGAISVLFSRERQHHCWNACRRCKWAVKNHQPKKWSVPADIHLLFLLSFRYLPTLQKASSLSSSSKQSDVFSPSYFWLSRLSPDHAFGHDWTVCPLLLFLIRRPANWWLCGKLNIYSPANAQLQTRSYLRSIN